MPRRVFFALLLLCWSGEWSLAAVVADATGRGVEVPEQIARVLPAGPPAAILLAALAPDLMLGWTSPVSDSARALLAPEAGKLPQVPRLTGRDDVVDKIVALKPDLILDYGTIAPRYVDLAKATQQRTGIPTLLLDGSLAEIPRTFRVLGSILRREDRAETLARFVEALLASPKQRDASLRVVCARGADGLDDIRALDPDVLVFSDPAMRATLARSDAWQSLRAVREGRAFVAPNMPFGWVDEPPSINRLLGFAWLGGSDPRTLAAQFNAAVYGRALTAPQLDTLLAGVQPLQP
jgi:iron complex transport system substrate-binding protein